MKRAFTLVELLVVVSIIVVLLALLVPALSRAVYEAQLVECASRTRVWASMGVQFAQDHQRRLPMSFGPSSAALTAQGYDELGARVPDRVSDITANEASGKWKATGTPWQTWLTYGLTDKIAVCPIWKGVGTLSANYLSYSPAAPHPQHYNDANNEFAGWGPQVWIGYQWLAGTDQTHSGAANVHAWRNRPPASRMTNAVSNSVVASDLLYMNRDWAAPPTNYRAVAHPADDSPAQPRSMSIAFGDTHVGIERESFFESPQIFGDNGLPTADRYSYLGGSSYYWWGK